MSDEADRYERELGINAKILRPILAQARREERAKAMRIQAIVVDQLIEVHNKGGGVVGYRLEMNQTKTKELWDAVLDAAAIRQEDEDE